MIPNKGTVHLPPAWQPSVRSAQSLRDQLKALATGQQPHWSGTTLDWNSVKGVQFYTQFTMSSGNQTWQWNREFSSVIFPIKTFKFNLWWIFQPCLITQGSSLWFPPLPKAQERRKQADSKPFMTWAVFKTPVGSWLSQYITIHYGKCLCTKQYSGMTLVLNTAPLEINTKPGKISPFFCSVHGQLDNCVDDVCWARLYIGSIFGFVLYEEVYIYTVGR